MNQHQLRVLKQLVDYDKQNGYFRTLLAYNPFGTRPAELNFDVDSQYGTVDVDWMLRIAYVAKFEFVAWLTFRTAKFYWNLIDPRRGGLRRRLSPLTIINSANERAVTAAHAWANGKRLAYVLAPALR
jgi:hypothetical protein